MEGLVILIEINASPSSPVVRKRSWKTGVEVHCTVYADVEPQSFTFLVPAGTTGPQTVRMTAHINGSLRSYTYSALITTA